MSHTTQLRGMASTLRMRTAITPEQWQPWTAVSAMAVRMRKVLAIPRSCVVCPIQFKLGLRDIFAQKCKQVILRKSSLKLHESYKTL